MTLVNSVGNIVEISQLLDKTKYNTAELTEHYQMLADKWGEIELMHMAAGGVSIRFINISNALFSGWASLYMTFTFASLACSITFGKLIFPILSKHYNDANTQLVDMATLNSAAKIEKMTKGKEWF